MLFCPKCQQLEASASQKHGDGTVTHLCKKCGSVIPLRRDLKPGEVVAGFKIEEELGRGAMGIVYQARQTNLDREVAIKILSDDSASDEVYVERFFREARAAASLSHPNVVQAYDAGVTDDGIYYFVMEKVTGENLDLVLNNVGPLNIPQALDVFLAVANALAYAWNRNQLSHGDIKPENIIMRLNGKVKLADFGLARRAKDPELADEDIRATPAYAPPEIIQDDKSVPGFKSDMYSFGATAYHILIGHEPFIDADPMKVCAMQLSEVQTPLSELNPNIPRRLSDLVDALMEKDPEERPATWNDVIDELKAIRQDLDAASGTAEQEKKKKSLSKRNPVSRKPSAKTSAIVAVVVALAVIAAIVAAVSLRHGGTQKDPDAPALTGKTSVSGDPAANISSKPGGAPARDEAFYRARWKMLLDEAGKSGPEMKQVEQFVSDAGAMAPDEAVRMLAALKAARDAETAQSSALILRNGLMDEADAFDAEKLGKLDFDQLDAMILSVQTRLAELKKLNTALTEPIFQPDQQKKVEEYLKKLTDLQLSSSLGGAVSSGTASQGTGADSKPDVSGGGTEPDRAEPKETDADADAAESGTDSKLLLNYLLLLDSLPDTLNDESDRAGAMRLLNDLLADKDFTDDVPRKNCIAIRNFLVLSQQAILPYLADNENVLRGMKLFPNSYPDSVLDDISDSTFRLKVPNEKASIIQKVPWSKLRSGEGEDRLVVTLINSPQLSKYAEDFREYLFIRAIFLGVDPDMLKKRYDRASGLSAAKRDELYRTAGFFQKSELDEEDD